MIDVWTSHQDNFLFSVEWASAFGNQHPKKRRRLGNSMQAGSEVMHSTKEGSKIDETWARSAARVVGVMNITGQRSRNARREIGISSVLLFNSAKYSWMCPFKSF